MQAKRSIPIKPDTSVVMYVPNHFNHEDASAALAFMQRFNFATLVSLVDGTPFASHLPFII